MFILHKFGVLSPLNGRSSFRKSIVIEGANIEFFEFGRLTRGISPMKTVKISHSQAQDFALAIFADIDAYVAAHRAEYEEFLRLEEKGNGEDEKS